LKLLTVHPVVVSPGAPFVCRLGIGHAVQVRIDAAMVCSPVISFVFIDVDVRLRWGFFIACALSSICILFFGAQFGITGFNYNMQPVIQMLGGYLHPGRPMANMYFVLFGYNSILQGQLLLRDLKFAQYAHLAPRATFTMQMVSISSTSPLSSIIFVLKVNAGWYTRR
jgi:hypothetical protein